MRIIPFAGAAAFLMLQASVTLNPATLAGGAPGSQSESQSVSEVLKETILKGISTDKLKLDEDGKSAIDGLAQTGANRLARMGISRSSKVNDVESKQDSWVRQARDNAQKLAKEIVSIAQKEHSAVTASIVAKAKKKLCPLFPFC